MILTSTTRAASLAAVGKGNNPLILSADLITAISSSNGVEAGGTATNATSDTTFDFALPTVSGAAADLEFTASAGIDCVGIAAHNLGTIGATVAVEYSDNGGSTWVDCGCGEFDPADDQAIIFRFAPQEHNDWRLSITGVAGAQPAIGVLRAGQEIVLPRRLYQGYAPPITPTNVEVQSNVSEGGHRLASAVIRQGSRTSVSVSNLPPAFIRSAVWRGFQRHYNAGGGFFWCWRPTKYGDAFYGWREGGALVPQNSGPLDLMSVQMGVRFYDDP